MKRRWYEKQANLIIRNMLIHRPIKRVPLLLKLQDYELLEVYSKAVRYNLDEDFILIVEDELNRRNLSKSTHRFETK